MKSNFYSRTLVELNPDTDVCMSIEQVFGTTSGPRSTNKKRLSVEITLKMDTERFVCNIYFMLLFLLVLINDLAF